MGVPASYGLTDSLNIHAASRLMNTPGCGGIGVGGVDKAGCSAVNASAAQPRTIPLISTNTYIPRLGRYINGTSVDTQVVPLV